jgi:hypothetical protein
VAVVKADVNLRAVARQRARVVVDLLGGDLSVGNDHGVAVGGAQHRRAPADFHDAALALPELDPIAHAERAIHVQQNTGQQVGQGALQGQADDGRQHRRGGHQRRHVHAALPENAGHHHHEAQHQDEIAQSSGKRMLARRGRISNTPITAVPMTPMATKNVDSMVSRRPMAKSPTPTVSKAQPHEGQERSHAEEDLQHSAVVAVLGRKHPAQEHQDDQRDQRRDQAHASPGERAGLGQFNQTLAQIHGEGSR